MTRNELLKAVQIYPGHRFGTADFILLDEIPEPWRSQFRDAICISACPVVKGFDACAYAGDWKSWVNGRWYGGEVRPAGLDLCHGRLDSRR
mgnify:CR=1